jgi:hypothetical protein
MSEPAEKIPPIRVVRVSDKDNQIGLRTRTVTVQSTSPRYRDNGKMFLITEKTAMQAELFAVKVLNVLASSGVELNGDAMSMGLRGLAQHGVQALGRLPIDLVEDIFSEMMACVQIIPDFKTLPEMSRKLSENDIQEVPSLMLLKIEVFELHTGFFEPVVSSSSSSDGNTGSTGNGSRTIQTSQRPSAQPSRQVRLR